MAIQPIQPSFSPQSPDLLITSSGSGPGSSGGDITLPPGFIRSVVGGVPGASGAGSGNVNEALLPPYYVPSGLANAITSGIVSGLSSGPGPGSSSGAGNGSPPSNPPPTISPEQYARDNKLTIATDIPLISWMAPKPTSKDGANGYDFPNSKFYKFERVDGLGEDAYRIKYKVDNKKGPDGPEKEELVLKSKVGDQKFAQLARYEKHDSTLAWMETQGVKVWNKQTFDTTLLQLGKGKAKYVITDFEDMGIIIVKFGDNKTSGVPPAGNDLVAFSQKNTPEAFNLIREYAATGNDQGTAAKNIPPHKPHTFLDRVQDYWATNPSPDDQYPDAVDLLSFPQTHDAWAGMHYSLYG